MPYIIYNTIQQYNIVYFQHSTQLGLHHNSHLSQTLGWLERGRQKNNLILSHSWPENGRGEGNVEGNIFVQSEPDCDVVVSLASHYQYLLDIFGNYE